MHIARFREMPYLARKHAGLFQARFDKHPNLKMPDRFLRCIPDPPVQLLILLLFVSFHASSSSSPIHPSADSPIRW